MSKGGKRAARNDVATRDGGRVPGCWCGDGKAVSDGCRRFNVTDLCRVPGGTRVVFLSGEVLGWSCVASTIKVRTILNT